MGVSEYNVVKLDELSPQTAAHAAVLLNDIPGAFFTASMVSASMKEDLVLKHRWDFSYGVFFKETVLVGVLLTFLKPPIAASENTFNEAPYSKESLYLDGLAVRKDFRRKGLGSLLIQNWLDASSNVLKDVPHSLQTNAASWNAPVVDLYKKFGFEIVGRKRYNNRIDVVMFRE